MSSWYFSAELEKFKIYGLLKFWKLLAFLDNIVGCQFQIKPQESKFWAILDPGFTREGPM